MWTSFARWSSPDCAPYACAALTMKLVGEALYAEICCISNQVFVAEGVAGGHPLVSGLFIFLVRGIVGFFDATRSCKSLSPQQVVGATRGFVSWVRLLCDSLQPRFYRAQHSNLLKNFSFCSTWRRLRILWPWFLKSHTNTATLLIMFSNYLKRAQSHGSAWIRCAFAGVLARQSISYLTTFLNIVGFSTVPALDSSAAPVLGPWKFRFFGNTSSGERGSFWGGCQGRDSVVPREALSLLSNSLPLADRCRQLAKRYPMIQTKSWWVTKREHITVTCTDTTLTLTVTLTLTLTLNLTPNLTLTQSPNLKPETWKLDVRTCELENFQNSDLFKIRTPNCKFFLKNFPDL